MHGILRSINRTVKGLATEIPRLATMKELLAQHPRVLFRRTSTQEPHQLRRDLGVPNPSWSQEMMDQFEKFTKMSEDGSWQRIPSYNNSVDSMPGQSFYPTPSISSQSGLPPANVRLLERWQVLHLQACPNNRSSRSFPLQFLSKLGYNPTKHPDACLFVRNVAAEGRGFEFAMFYNGSERRMAVPLQTGSYLEGMIGFVHGGAVAAILDHTFASCGICASGIVVTANLSVSYKSPIPLGSVVLVETKVEKVEEKKIFLSGCVQSTNARILHAEAT
ncbi:acyl-coenzyme A thioesterase THEM4-like, partial [Notechis scutatus]|uniref:Acyl-coenzyme A thioesterase THEM4 n=1 Tax=Notechis scutatus TaxID=8663 RepID=A0A6J1VWG6_9SAUR